MSFLRQPAAIFRLDPLVGMQLFTGMVARASRSSDRDIDANPG
jgi:hypothetical protein